MPCPFLPFPPKCLTHSQSISIPIIYSLFKSHVNLEWGKLSHSRVFQFSMFPMLSLNINRKGLRRGVDMILGQLRMGGAQYWEMGGTNPMYTNS